MGVMTLMGISVLAGRVEIRLHRSVNAAPVRSVTGSSRRWSEVERMRRAMWGTARPMKAMGPQKAVEVAVRIPVVKSSRLRVRGILIPRFSA